MKRWDIKILVVGQTWDLGDGWSLKPWMIDVDGNKVWLKLFKDGALKKEAIIKSDSSNYGDRMFIYKTTLGGQSNYPEFVVYVDAVVRGTDANLVVLKYAFLVSDNVVSINVDDTFGVFKVKSVGATITLNNSATVTLTRNSDVALMGDMKIKVADTSDLKFYPFASKTILRDYEIRGSPVMVTSQTSILFLTPTPTKMPIDYLFYAEIYAGAFAFVLSLIFTLKGAKWYLDKKRIERERFEKEKAEIIAMIEEVVKK
jgi:hypothetical protein